MMSSPRVTRFPAWGVIAIASAMHVILLGFSDCVHSPTVDETVRQTASRKTKRRFLVGSGARATILIS